MRLRRAMTLVAVSAVAVSISAAAPAAEAAPLPAASSSTAKPYTTSQRGLLPLMHRVHGAAVTSAGAAARPKGARALHALRVASAAVPAAGRAATPTAGPLLQNFNGVSSRDSEFTNYDAEFEPPDQGLCAGNGFVLEPVNSAYSIYTSGGKRLRGPFNVNDLFDEGGEEFTSDPRCYYDPDTQRWFATILFLNASFTAGRIDIATSVSSDPTGLWHQFQIDTTDAGQPGCPCFGDQPRMGIDGANIYVSTDEFSINGPEYYGGQLYAITKADLVNGASAHFVHFGGLRVGGTLAGAVEPAITTGSPGAEYFMNSLDPNGAGDNRLGVWAMTHVGRVATGGLPDLVRTVVSSEAYGPPPATAQKGSSSGLDSGDDRMQQTQYIGGLLWGELDTALTVPGDSTQRAGAAWFAVRPSVTPDGPLTATIARQGYVSQAGDNLLYPALQADAAGRAAMVFTISGTDRYPSAAYATLPSAGNTFSAVAVAAAGTGPYDPNAGRWGDYSFAVKDPSSDAIWLATEYVPPKASQTTDRLRNWGTRVFEVGLS